MRAIATRLFFDNLNAYYSQPSAPLGILRAFSVVKLTRIFGIVVLPIFCKFFIIAPLVRIESMRWHPLQKSHFTSIKRLSIVIIPQESPNIRFHFIEKTPVKSAERFSNKGLSPTDWRS